MLKVRLLNDGGYGDMENVKFPVIVEGESFAGHQGCDILGSELIKVGANNDYDVWDPNYRYFFEYDTECEVINENKNEGKKNIQIDEDVYLKLKELSRKVGMPMRHYLQGLINEKANG